jgi:hypothetical protein
LTGNGKWPCGLVSTGPTTKRAFARLLIVPAEVTCPGRRISAAGVVPPVPPAADEAGALRRLTPQATCLRNLRCRRCRPKRPPRLYLTLKITKRACWRLEISGHRLFQRLFSNSRSAPGQIKPTMKYSG